MIEKVVQISRFFHFTEADLPNHSLEQMLPVRENPAKGTLQCHSARSRSADGRKSPEISPI